MVVYAGTPGMYCAIFSANHLVTLCCRSTVSAQMEFAGVSPDRDVNVKKENSERLYFSWSDAVHWSSLKKGAKRTWDEGAGHNSKHTNIDLCKERCQAEMQRRVESTFRLCLVEHYSASFHKEQQYSATHNPDVFIAVCYTSGPPDVWSQVEVQVRLNLCPRLLTVPLSPSPRQHTCRPHSVAVPWNWWEHLNFSFFCWIHVSHLNQGLGRCTKCHLHQISTSWENSCVTLWNWGGTGVLRVLYRNPFVCHCPACTDERI